MKQASRIRKLALLLPCITLLCAIKPAMASDYPLKLRLAAGGSWQTRNDVQIPNTDQGTRFSLSDAAGEGPANLLRIEINWAINDRHGIRVLLAPLSFTETVTFNEPVEFDGGSFSSGQPTEASYRFNSWRLGYHYSIKRSDALDLKIGATLKVRDAEIRLVQGDTVSSNDNVGFVPLLYLAAKYRVNDRWSLSADLDGLAGGPGRAIDLGVAVEFSLTDRWQIGAELRVLDGGAATDEVYNFARFNSAAIVIGTGF